MTLLFFILVAVPVAIFAYGCYGHAFVQAIYEGKSFHGMNAFIEGQSRFSLQNYLEIADGMFFATIFFSTLALFIFWVWKKQAFGSRGRWTMSGGLILGMVAAAFFRPTLFDAEWFCLINPRRIADPGFLTHDWTWQHGVRGHFFFDRMISLFFVFLSPLQTALLVRAAVWTLIAVAFLKLAKTLTLKWWQAALAFAFWFYAGQSMPQWEWVFGSLHAKCFAYLFLLLGLSEVLNGRVSAAGICAGISASFYPMIGGWGGLAFAGALFIPLRREEVKQFFKFGGAFFLCALPGLIPFFLYAFSHTLDAKRDYEMLAFFRAGGQAPFLPLRTAVQLAAAPCALLLVGKSFEWEQARKLRVFLIVLIFFFILGPVGKLGVNFSFSHPIPRGLRRFSFCWCFLLARSPFFGRGLLLSCALLGALMYVRMPEKLFKHTAYFWCDWKSAFVNHEGDDFSQLVRWVKTRTKRESVFVTPPWEDRFALSAERPQVVYYKNELMNTSISEWMRRLGDLNGGKRLPYKKCEDAFRANYPNLSTEQLKRIKTQYGARYYLTTRARPDLGFLLSYSNQAYFLYDLGS